MRIAIAGVPQAGKTTLGEAISSAPLCSTDWYLGRRDIDDVLVGFLEERRSPWVMEGCRVVHALRLWLSKHPEGQPCDAVLWMPRSRHALTPGQRIFAKGIWSIWREVKGELERRDVKIWEVA